MPVMEYLAHSARDGFPSQPYAAHLEHVSTLAVKYAREAGGYAATDGSALAAAAATAAYYHDLGKLEPENQRALHQNPSPAHLPIHHADAGTAALLLREDYTAAIVSSHHQGLPDYVEEQSRSTAYFRDDDPLTRQHTDAILPQLLAEQRQFGAAPATTVPFPSQDPAVFMRVLLSCLCDADHTDTAQHYGQTEPAAPLPELRAAERLAVLDRYVTGLAAPGRRAELRAQMYQSCRNAAPWGNIVSCDSPVGSGKTTAVMAHLLRQATQRGLRRIFVVLPYTNIITQSVDTYRKALVLPGEDPEAVVAELHHRADFENETMRHLTALWRAPIVVTTAVAFFETLAANKPAALRRLHELPGSAIFVDEAHAALPVGLLPLAWHWMQVMAKDWQCYWVLASGSLVRFWEIPGIVPETVTQDKIAQKAPPVAELVAPTLRSELMQYENNRIRFCRNETPLSRAQFVQWVTKFPGPCLIIVNTVQSAAVLAQDLARLVGQEQVEHLSTALDAVDREKVIQKVSQRLADEADNHWFLVATSCVEAGVDFSFRTGFRELSSLLSLLQAAGRVNRNGKYPDAEMWSFTFQDDPLLRKNPGIEQAAKVLEKYFECHVSITPDLSTRCLIDELERLDATEEKRRFLMDACMAMNFKTVAENFVVIDDDRHVTAIADGDLIQEIRAGHSDWKTIQKHSFQIPFYLVKDLHLTALDTGIYIWDRGYDDFLGYMAGLLSWLQSSGAVFA